MINYLVIFVTIIIILLVNIHRKILVSTILNMRIYIVEFDFRLNINIVHLSTN